MRFSLRFSFATAISLAVLTGCAGPSVMPPQTPSALLAKPLPDFKRRTTEGASVDTAALRGKVVVVKFFAKYCEPCKKTLPAVEALAKRSTQVAFVGIAEDESMADVLEVVREYELTFPIVHDQGNVLSGRYRVRDLPVTFVADAKGVVRWVGGSGQGEDDLADALSAVR